MNTHAALYIRHQMKDYLPLVLSSSATLSCDLQCFRRCCYPPFLMHCPTCGSRDAPKMPLKLTDSSYSFHLDHASALPYVLAKTNFRGRVFMTHPTKAIYKWLIQDSVRVQWVLFWHGKLRKADQTTGAYHPPQTKGPPYTQKRSISLRFLKSKLSTTTLHTPYPQSDSLHTRLAMFLEQRCS